MTASNKSAFATLITHELKLINHNIHRFADRLTLCLKQ